MNLYIIYFKGSPLFENYLRTWITAAQNMGNGDYHTLITLTKIHIIALSFGCILVPKKYKILTICLDGSGIAE
jgi:hypothetical protein